MHLARPARGVQHPEKIFTISAAGMGQKFQGCGRRLPPGSLFAFAQSKGYENSTQNARNMWSGKVRFLCPGHKRFSGNTFVNQVPYDILQRSGIVGPHAKILQVFFLECVRTQVFFVIAGFHPISSSGHSVTKLAIVAQWISCDVFVTARR
jgi:hypothetical protein